MKERKLALETLTIHGGYQIDETKAISMPIYPSTAFHFPTADYGANLFDLKEAGNIYSRLTNPTWDAFAEKVNVLEGGVGALATSSGQAAITLAVLNICQSGDHILATTTLYGGTFALFNNTLKKLGISVTFIDSNLSIEELKTFAQDNTKLVFGETIGNPRNSILDIEKFADLAHEIGVPLIIDNTYPTPFLFRPFEHGADIIVHSATKYLGGHGNALGGIIVDSGNFNWDNGNFPELTTEDESYHGTIYTRDFGPAAYIVKARVQLLRDLGSTLSPFNAFLIHTGMETLHLRMERHSSNSLALAQWLEAHPSVEWVSHPLLKSHPEYALAQKYFKKGSGGMLAFGVKGGLDEGKKVINSFKLAIHGANLGDTRTIVSHPASTTHRQLSPEDLLKAGVTPNLIRISTGLESIEDLIADFNQALEII